MVFYTYFFEKKGDFAKIIENLKKLVKMEVDFLAQKLPNYPKIKADITKCAQMRILLYIGGKSRHNLLTFL